jgi:hypothetical protein
MIKVKKIFFLTEEEVKKLKDGYVSCQHPHYELTDGTIMYAKWGAPAAGEVWYEPLKPKK